MPRREISSTATGHDTPPATTHQRALLNGLVTIPPYQGPLQPPEGMMSHSPKHALEDAATKLLAVYGVKAIWDMQLAAAAAHGMGEPELAASLIKLAEAAEECLMRSPTCQPT